MIAMTEHAPSQIASVTPAVVAQLLADLGCRAEIGSANGQPMIGSALHGAVFTVHFGNPQPGSPQEAQYGDLSLVYAPRIDGIDPGSALPAWLEAAVAGWNIERRFARLAVLQGNDGPYLALRWDVLTIAVGRAQLVATLQLWDQLMQEFFLFLRSRAPLATEAQAA